MPSVGRIKQLSVLGVSQPRSLRVVGERVRRAERGLALGLSRSRRRGRSARRSVHATTYGGTATAASAPATPTTAACAARLDVATAPRSAAAARRSTFHACPRTRRSPRSRSARAFTGFGSRRQRTSLHGVGSQRGTLESVDAAPTSPPTATDRHAIDRRLDASSGTVQRHARAARRRRRAPRPARPRSTSRRVGLKVADTPAPTRSRPCGGVSGGEPRPTGALELDVQRDRRRRRPRLRRGRPARRPARSSRASTVRRRHQLRATSRPATPTRRPAAGRRLPDRRARVTHPRSTRRKRRSPNGRLHARSSASATAAGNELTRRHARCRRPRSLNNVDLGSPTADAEHRHERRRPTPSASTNNNAGNNGGVAGATRAVLPLAAPVGLARRRSRCASPRASRSCSTTSATASTAA